MLSEIAMIFVQDKLAFDLPGAVTCIGGSRCGDVMAERERISAAMYVWMQSNALAAAKSPCRGAARRCAAALIPRKYASTEGRRLHAITSL